MELVLLVRLEPGGYPGEWVNPGIEQGQRLAWLEDIGAVVRGRMRIFRRLRQPLLAHCVFGIAVDGAHRALVRPARGQRHQQQREDDRGADTEAAVTGDVGQLAAGNDPRSADPRSAQLDARLSAQARVPAANPTDSRYRSTNGTFRLSTCDDIRR